MIAVSLKLGGGVRLIKLAKMYICMQTHYKHDEDGCTALGVCGHGSVLVSHSWGGGGENWITHTQQQTKAKPKGTDWSTTSQFKHPSNFIASVCLFWLFYVLFVALFDVCLLLICCLRC